MGGLSQSHRSLKGSETRTGNGLPPLKKGKKLKIAVVKQCDWLRKLVQYTLINSRSKSSLTSYHIIKKVISFVQYKLA